MIEFVGFPKIPRYSRECIVTEKIDGTNAQVYIVAMDKIDPDLECEETMIAEFYEGGQYYRMFAGSRSRWISPEKDNHGFARWAKENQVDLFRLGVGRHFGEWWGQGINRGYGLKEKRFSLFNIHRWGDGTVRPSCCDVVPVLYRGPFTTGNIEHTLTSLANYGSHAAPGFMRPEGIIIYHVAGNYLFQKTIENDEKPKGGGE